MQEPNDQAAVRASLEQWLAAFNAKDADTLMSLYDRGSLYANAAAPLARGEAQIRPWYEAAFAAVTGTLLFREEAIVVEGRMALLIGKYCFQSTGDAGRVALVYRRSDDGRWLLLFDMDNTPPDVSPDDFR